MVGTSGLVPGPCEECQALCIGGGGGTSYCRVLILSGVAETEIGVSIGWGLNHKQALSNWGTEHPSRWSLLSCIRIRAIYSHLYKRIILDRLSLVIFWRKITWVGHLTFLRSRWRFLVITDLRIVGSGSADRKRIIRNATGRGWNEDLISSTGRLASSKNCIGLGSSCVVWSFTCVEHKTSTPVGYQELPSGLSLATLPFSISRNLGHSPPSAACFSGACTSFVKLPAWYCHYQTELATSYAPRCKDSWIWGAPSRSRFGELQHLPWFNSTSYSPRVANTGERQGNFHSFRRNNLFQYTLYIHEPGCSQVTRLLAAKQRIWSRIRLIPCHRVHEVVGNSIEEVVAWGSVELKM
jgi:hypothetical protein